MGIYLLDCTLRDGGHVVSFNFGEKMIKSNLEVLEKAGVEYIEAGFLKDCDYKENQVLYNNSQEFQKVLGSGVHSSDYVLMLQVDQYDIHKLEKCNGAIKNIRVSFHYHDRDVGLEYCRHVIDKGYRCHVNPINFVGYTDQEKKDLILKVNELSPAFFTIVDTYGFLLPKELEHIVRLVNRELRYGIGIGLHLHDNLKMAFALSQNFLNMRPNKRNVIIDATLVGFGKAPGNLCMELIAWYLNENFHKSYCLKKFYYLIDTYIMPLVKRQSWGYNPCYAMTAQHRLSRNYAQYFTENHQVGTETLEDLLYKVKKHENGGYRQQFAEDIYTEWKSLKQRNRG